MLTNILIAIVVIHLIAGFGWLVYKLAPRKGEELIDSYNEEENITEQTNK